MFDEEPWNQDDVVSLVVAGRVVDYAFNEVSNYLDKHFRTFRECDLRAGHWLTLSEAAIATTRRPFLNSRISRRESLELRALAETADWDLVTVKDRLVDADPLEVDGLYDRGDALYRHFLNGVGPGISVGKIHKILYVMRPHFFPILDSRLRRVYSGVARRRARHLREVHGRRGAHHGYWAVIRDDLVANAEGIAIIRDQMSEVEGEMLSEIGGISDVRLLDMVAWQINPDVA